MIEDQVVNTEINEQQVQQEAQALNQQMTTQEVAPLPEDRYASLVGSFSKMFTKQMQKEAAKEGERKFIEREVARSTQAIETQADELVKAPSRTFDFDEPYQVDFDRINNASDVVNEIALLNEKNKEAIQTQRRNVVPDVELRELANDLSTDEETIKKVLKLKPGEILPPEYILSMKQVMTQSGRKLRDLATKIKDGSATDIDKIGFHKQWEFHSQFNKQFMGVRAEYGRGLRALGVTIDDSVPLGEIMNRISSNVTDERSMADQILLATDNKSLNRVIESQRGIMGKSADAVHELFISSILSGVQTHIVNTASNALKAVFSPLDTFVASHLKSSGPEIVQKGEASAQLQGMFESNWEALQMAFKVLKTGEAYGGASKVDVDYAKAISANALGIKEGTTAAWMADATGKFVRLPVDNLMGAEDAFFKVLHEGGALRQLAHRKATAQGLSGADYADEVARLMENPDKDMLQQVYMAGLKGTFQQELGPAGKGIQQLRNKIPGASFIVPFIKTPLNLLYEGFMERTPLGLLSKDISNKLKAGGAEAQMTKARMMIGTALNGTLLGIAMNNQITGGTPKDPKLRQAWKDAGVQPYSFVTTNDDGSKEYLSFDRLEPFNSILALYANINQTIQVANLDGDNPDASKEMEKLAAGIGIAFSEATINKTFMQGLQQFLEAVTDPKAHSTSFVKNYLQAMVPLSGTLKNIKNEMDPYIRDASDRLLNITKNLPILSEGNVPILDNFGKKIEVDHNFIPAFMKVGVEGTTDKLRQEVLRLTETTKSVPVYKPEKTIGGYKLKPQEYYDYTNLATNEIEVEGKTMQKMMRETISSSEYKAMNDYQRVTSLEAIRNAYYQAAKAQLKQRYPHIIKYDVDLKTYKANKLMEGVE